MAKYRKKPIVIDAEVFKSGLEDGFDTIEIIESEGQDLNLDELEYFDTDHGKKYPYIRTLEGKHYIHKGSYIITGVNGERYPCKPDIFEKTYEPANKEVIETAKAVIDTINKMQRRTLACSSVLNI